MHTHRTREKLSRTVSTVRVSPCEFRRDSSGVFIFEKISGTCNNTRVNYTDYTLDYPLKRSSDNPETRDHTCTTYGASRLWWHVHAGLSLRLCEQLRDIHGLLRVKSSDERVCAWNRRAKSARDFVALQRGVPRGNGDNGTTKCLSKNISWTMRINIVR